MRIKNLKRRIAASLVASGVLCGSAAWGATTLTGLAATNAAVPTDHGSFQPGTPDLGLTWGGNWDQYGGWPNDPADGVYQIDGAGDGTVTHTIAFTPAASVQVVLSTFDLNVWPGGGDTGVDWSLDGASSGNLGSGTMTTPDGTVVNYPVNLTGAAGEALTLSLTQTSGVGSYLAMDNLAFDQIGLVNPFLELHIDRSDGSATLENPSGVPVGIQGYAIRSNIGALDSAEWTTITGNYDNTPGTGDGSVDSNDIWTVLTDVTTPTHDDLSEFQFGGDGGVVAARASVDLGVGAWIQNAWEDITDLSFEYTSPAGEVRQGVVVAAEGSPGPLQLGDLDFDGDIDRDDWGIFKTGQQQDMTGLTVAQSYQMGDLDRDLKNNHPDFVLFKEAFTEANGAGSFEAMLASVPEPSCFMLLVGGGLMAMGWRRSRNRE